jgi:hypothetical protein
MTFLNNQFGWINKKKHMQQKNELPSFWIVSQNKKAGRADILSALPAFF